MAWLFDSALTVGHKGSVEDPKKALGCMRLGLGKGIPAGDAVMVCAEGEDAEAAVELLARVISGEQKLTGEFESRLSERKHSRYKALRNAGLHPWQCEDPTLGFAERKVVVHESATRGMEGMNSAMVSAYLRRAAWLFESRITIGFAGKEASVRSPMALMGGFDKKKILAGDEVLVKAMGEDAEVAVAFLSGCIAGEISMRDVFREAFNNGGPTIEEVAMRYVLEQGAKSGRSRHEAPQRGKPNT
jgi:phosphotransferase system HPr-like phosphotransfer protein